MHEPRWKQGLGVGYVVSPTGPDHVHNMHDSNFTTLSPLLEEMRGVGILGPLPVDDLSPAKIRLLIYNSVWAHFLNCAVCCYFVMFYGLVGFERTARLVSAVTGWETSSFELMKVGERAVNLAQCFNLREGFSRKDDTLPERYFKEPTPIGLPIAKGKKIDKDKFERMLDEYYLLHGWDENGFPKKETLESLRLDKEPSHMI